MCGIILGVWGIVIVVVYFCGLFAIPYGIAFFGALVVLAIISVCFVATDAKGLQKLSADQEQRLSEARKHDEENRRKNSADILQQKSEISNQIESLEKQKTEYERKQAQHLYRVRDLDILGRNEQNLSAVNALIDIMESHRADTIPEALRVYDAQRHYHNQVVQAQFNERMNLLEQKWQRQEQFDRDMAAAAHRREVEALLQKQLDALEQD